MREARVKFGIIWVPDGRLFAIGGKISSGGSTSTVEMLDTTNQISTSNAVWKSVASMSNPRESHGVAFLDGKLVAVGGTDECSVEVFTLPTKDNVLGQWSTIYPLPSPLTLQALLPVDNLLIGIRESGLPICRLLSVVLLAKALPFEGNIGTTKLVFEKKIRNVIYSTKGSKH